MPIDIIGIKYDSPQMDFSTLIHHSQRTLFIFNDNWKEHYSSKRGSGNAIIRPYNQASGLSIPKSFGIPTGDYRNGYSYLLEGKQSIDISLNELQSLISTGNYDRIIYSIDDYRNPILGRGIFLIGDEVKRYITKQIIKMGLGGKYYFMSARFGTECVNEITQTMVDSFDLF